MSPLPINRPPTWVTNSERVNDFISDIDQRSEQPRPGASETVARPILHTPSCIVNSSVPRGEQAQVVPAAKLCRLFFTLACQSRPTIMTRLGSRRTLFHGTSIF